jgi:hypothetical protein
LNAANASMSDGLVRRALHVVFIEARVHRAITTATAAHIQKDER